MIMAVVQALQDAGTALRHNPIVIAVVVVLMLLQLPTQFAQLAGPIASAVLGLIFTVVMIVVAPFLFSGLLGMADEALDSTTSFDTFVDAGKQYYTSMLGAYLLMFGVMVVVGIIASIISFVLVATIGMTTGGPSGSTDPLFIGMFLAGTGVFLLVLFVPLFFVQFYGQAIVLDDQTAIDGIKRSIHLVRRNLVSVAGYSLLVFGAGLVFGALGSIPSTLLSMQMTPVSMGVPLPDVALPVVVALTVVANIFFGLLGSLFLVFSVAFYRTLDSTENSSEPSAPEGTVA